MTAGDAILDTDDLRTRFGSTGAAVKVGVVADGLEGLAEAQASGDLPASGINTTTCDGVAAVADPEDPADPTSFGAGSEGTAEMEIVHDIAPSAELWFGYFGMNVATSTVLDFMAAVDCLARHVDVIVDDIVFVNTGPYDGTSEVSKNASTQMNAPDRMLRGYYNAVGNFVLQHYQGPFVDEVPGHANDSDFHLSPPRVARRMRSARGRVTSTAYSCLRAGSSSRTCNGTIRGDSPTTTTTSTCSIATKTSST